MQILLNLLPQEQKDKNIRKFRFRFLLMQTSLLFGLLLFYTGILGGIYYLLNQEAKLFEASNSTRENHSEEALRLNKIQEKFKETNLATLAIERYTKGHLRWTNLFILLDRLTGKGIVIVDLLTKDYTVTLNGQAETRDDFLAFEEQLKASDCISDVKVPISNLFSQKEIEFQVDFNVKRDCLIRNPR